MLRPMLSIRLPVRLSAGAALAGLLLFAGCARKGGCVGEYCGTLVIATAGEPDILLPAVSGFSITRDVTDQLFLKLADLGMSGNTVGDEDFQPRLAERWEWDAPTTLVFHLDPRAHWQDGRPVTAADVAFTYDAYTDPTVASPSRPSLRQIAAVTTRDSLTVVFRFRQRYPEMFYDAVYHMRVLPSHLLRELPRDIWRFAADQTAAVRLLTAGDADAVEVLVTPDNVTLAKADTLLTLYRYKGNAYGYLGFNLAAPGDSTKPHPLFGDRELRRALLMAVDRQGLLRNVWEDLAKVPPGPMSQLSWIWDPETRELPYDTAQAARRLARLGWTDSGGDGIREHDGHPLAFRLLVPTTSAVRRHYARLLQEQYRTIGVDVQLDEVDFSLFTERARTGRFDALLWVWNTDPTPTSGIPEVWTRAGFGGFNYGRYENPAFERLVDHAVAAAANRADAKRTWRAAIELLNQDAPAVFLFAPGNVAAVDRRVTDVTIRPDSWVALLYTWRIPADRLTDRDRVER